MGAKVDLLIKECGDFFNSQFSKYEINYKKFVETYNNAINNTQAFNLFLTYSSDNDSKTKVDAKPTTIKILRNAKFEMAPGSILDPNKKIFDPDIKYSAKTKTNAQLGLNKKLEEMGVDISNAGGIMFYSILTNSENIVTKWIIFNDSLEVENRKIWPRDFFPDKPDIKTYGEFYKWLFNIENGSIFYNEKDVDPSYVERIDPVTGENEKNRKVTPVGGSGAPFNIPTKLEDKIKASPTQQPIYKDLKSKYDDVQTYNMYKYAKEITAEKYSKKILEKTLEKVQSNTILTKWTAKTPNSLWYDGLSGNTSFSNSNIGIAHITSREYPFKQDYYGGSFWFFIDNPWSATTTLYDALFESVNEKKDLIVGSQSNVDPDPVLPVAELKIDPLNVNGKVILKVKSGPGAIIGETEIDIKSGVSIFKGIQFDKAGDYVVSVTSTSPDTIPTEFKIKVTPEPEVIEQDESRGKEEEISGNRPIIAQIDKPTIILPPMEFDRPVSDADAELVADSIGAMPFVNYMGSNIQDRDILSLSLFHNGIIPKCKIMFIDTNGLMKTVGAPQEDSKFEVFINAKSNNLKSIHLKFKVENFKDMTDGLYNITGILDLSELYRIKYDTITGTSFEVIRKLCKSIGLGFNSNILNTNDSMNWNLNGKKVYESISEIIKHSYISDTSFMSGYIDYYYCFNYVDVEKESKRDISKDVGIETGLDQKDTIAKVVRLKLINEPSMNKSCFYFNDNIVTKNDSTQLSTKKGNQTIVKSYDRNEKVIQVFKVDALTTDGSKSIILKGAKYDKEAFDNNVTTKYVGKMDTDNVHNNFLYAEALNERNLDDLKKLEMKLVLPSHNLNLYKLQKVDVSVVNPIITVANKDKIVWRQSGEWIISDISYNFISENSKKIFSQEVKLMRKELGKTPDEISKDEPVEKKDEKNDKVNPNPDPIIPNSYYDLGGVYRVKDNKGEEYWIFIKAYTDDGNGVFGTLTSIKNFDEVIDSTTTEKQPVKVVTPPLDEGLKPVIF